jgi:VCBS repeat-containing protein
VLSGYSGSLDDIYISPDSKAYVKGNGIVTVISPDGQSDEVDLGGNIIGGPIVFSQDGSSAYVIVGDDDGAFVKNVVTGDESQKIAFYDGFALAEPGPGTPVGEPIVVGQDGTAYLFTQSSDGSRIEIVALGTDGSTFAPISFDKAGDIDAIQSIGFTVSGDKAYIAISGIDMQTNAGYTQLVEVSKSAARTLADVDGLASSAVSVAPDGLVYVTIVKITSPPPNLVFSSQVNVFDPSAPVGNFAPRSGSYTAEGPATDGTVTGTVTAVDPNNDPLSYSGSGTTGSGGTYQVQPNGAYSYTPTADARHDAAEEGAPTSVTQDSFTVVVSDGQGGTLNVLVTVTIDPTNTPPEASVTVGDPDEDTGVVTGSVTSTDIDGDTRTYSGPTSSPLGSTIDVEADGTFTYTPTQLVRQLAAQSPGLTESFTITVSDGYGGFDSVDVQVTVAPPSASDPAPIEGSPTGNAIVDTAGNIYQVVNRPDGAGGVESVVRVYSADGTLIGDSEVISGTPSFPAIERTDGGISVVTFDVNTYSTTVTVVKNNAGVVTTTATTLENTGPLGGLASYPGLNPEKHLIANSSAGFVVVPLSAGTPAAHVINSEPVFTSNGSVLGFRYVDESGTLETYLVKIGPDGSEQLLTAPEFTSNSVVTDGVVAVGDSVYVTTVVNDEFGQPVSTEVLVFANGATTATKVALDRPAVGAAVGGPDGSVYQVTRDVSGDLVVSEITGTVNTTAVIPNSENYVANAVGVADNGTLYLHLAAETDRMIVVRPDGTFSDVDLGGFLYSNETVQNKVLGDNIYVTVRTPEFALVGTFVITPDGTQRILSDDGSSVIAVRAGEDGTVHVYMYNGDVFIRSSADDFATVQVSESFDGYPWTYDETTLQAGPNGLVYAASTDDNGGMPTVTAFNSDGEIVASVTVPNGVQVGPVAFDDNGIGYATFRVGGFAPEDAVSTQVWAIGPTGAVKVAEVLGRPATWADWLHNETAVDFGDDGTVYLTAVQYDAALDESTTTVHLIDPPTVL